MNGLLHVKCEKICSDLIIFLGLAQYFSSRSLVEIHICNKISEAINDTNDDEASDPEFNILDELEMEKTDLIEEMRSDRAVNISSMYFGVGGI